MNKKQLMTFAVAGIGTYFVYRQFLNRKNTPETTKQFIQKWIDTVCQHNPQAIVDLYAPDGVLLGTVADNMKVGRQQIIEYFNMFVQKKPCGQLTQINVQNFGPNYAIADGTYTFELTNEDGKVDSVPARFTFVLRKVVGGPNTPNRGGWVIASHHSSKQPN